jgi:hypothetical protein
VSTSWERSLSALISKLRALLASVGIPDVALTGSFGHYQPLLPADVWIDVEAAGEAIDLRKAPYGETNRRKPGDGRKQLTRSPECPS